MIFPTSPVVLVVGVVSAGTLYRSAQSIPKLQKYEEDAKRAAEWSTTAENRLWGTRYTVGAGFVAVSTPPPATRRPEPVLTVQALLSALTAVIYLLFVGRGAAFYRVGWPLFLAGGHYWTARYMTGFWDGKAKVPLMNQYNSAIDDSKQVIKLLDPVAVGWVAIAVLKLVGL